MRPNAARIDDCVVDNGLVWVTVLVEPHGDAALQDGGVEPVEAPGGGVLHEIAAPGDAGSVVRANARLLDSGALQPLPTPMETATPCQ